MLAGSLNLLPPGDLISEGDSLQLQNWRVDQAGQLRSRKGMTGESSVLTDFPVFRMFRAAQDRYAFAGSRVVYGTNLGTRLFSQFDGGYTPRASPQCGFASMSGAVWFMNDAIRKWMIGPTIGQWGITAPDVAVAVTQSGAVPVLPAGEYRYYVTFANDFGQESNPGPGSVESTAAWYVLYTPGVGLTFNGTPMSVFALTAIPTSSDPQVTRRNIYRVGGGVLSAQQIYTIEDNSTTSWTDNVSIADQQALGKPLSLDFDLPPAALGLAGPYFSRLIAFRSFDRPGRFWWSKPAQPWAWPGADDANEGNWEDCGDVREAILAASVRTRQLRLFKERSIWRIDGDPESADPEMTTSSVGIVGPNALASYRGLDYFVGDEGVYVFNGDREEQISDKTGPIFKGEYTKIGDAYVPPMNQDLAWLTSLAQRNGRLYLSYASIGQWPDSTLVYDIDGKRWYSHKLDANTFSNTGFTALYDEGQNGVLLAACVNPVSSKVFSLEQGTEDSGSPIPLIWQSQYWDAGLPDHEKVHQDLTFEYSTRDDGEAAAAASLTVKAIYDNGAAVEAVGTLSGTGRDRKVFTLGSYPGRMARNVSIRVEGYAHTTCRIFSCTLNYYAEPGKAKNFDSGVLDFGHRNLKEFQALEMDIEVSGTVTLSLYNDTGGVLSVAASKTLYTYGRGLLAIYSKPTQWDSLSKGIDAKLYRILLTAADGAWFKLYGMRAKVLPAGVYLDSSQAWVPAAFSL